MNCEKRVPLINQSWWLVFLLLLVLGCQLGTDSRELTNAAPSVEKSSRVWDTSYTGDVNETADFNGDGYEDTIEPSGGSTVNSIVGAGKVTISYGNDAIADQIWHQDSPGIEGVCETNDLFGSTAEPGDFNGDGYDDLAIGVVYEAVNSITRAGCINVIYGSANGLTATGNQIWHQNSSGIEGVCEADDTFGRGLVAADFNGDGYTDLVVSVPNESVGTLARAGAVNLLLGSVNGLTSTGNQIWYPNSSGIAGDSKAYGYFGKYMVAGEFNNDNYYDLVVSAPSAEVNGTNYAGAVYYIPGCSSGLTATGSQEWTAASEGIDNDIIYLGYFGQILLAGNFNNLPGTGTHDLAIGYPKATSNGQSEAGEVYVLFGSSITGFEPNRIITFNRYTLGISGSPTANDHFGKHLESGQYDSLDYEDIRIESDILGDAYLYGYNFGMSGNPF